MGKKATLKPVILVRLTDSDHCFCHGSDGCGGMCNIAPCLNSFKGSKAGSHKLSVEFKGMKCMFHILPSGEKSKRWIGDDWGVEGSMVSCSWMNLFLVVKHWLFLLIYFSNQM